MRLQRATVCLPVKSRAAAHAFYTALGFAAVGELDDDGMPEPLQFEISAGLRVMLIPTVGFGWVINGRKRAPRGAHECLFVVARATDRAVDAFMRKAREAGAKIVAEARSHRWGYAGTFADPDGHLWLVSRADGVLTR
jgi:predicted lactoylglutathione lyase